MILDDLYFRNSEIRETSEEYQDLEDRLAAYETRIKQTMGLAFLDEYTDLTDRLSELRERRFYRAGARFAVRFLLEVLL